ncbi:hypothetical protein Pmani_018778 [Petrolisthes manimaculis]|uniref:Uncharacterized protein n=1 Tax=Petrolisthes manimaculis TaxID=1843537 RepID=A0AAE1PLT0_9EUCA|nr:hypothetical protein Pmani_018778 [Petrolisthes manimaculis]
MKLLLRHRQFRSSILHFSRSIRDSYPSYHNPTFSSLFSTTPCTSSFLYQKPTSSFHNPTSSRLTTTPPPSPPPHLFQQPHLFLPVPEAHLFLPQPHFIPFYHNHNINPFQTPLTPSHHP